MKSVENAPNEHIQSNNGAVLWVDRARDPLMHHALRRRIIHDCRALLIESTDK